ncbi:MAG: hypothetical protein DRP56_01215 [Planctomycetota bacterium]|nr:MAG: hypothetical protein DRP56_01215 [Planctomycetota bacterium]
MINLLVHSCVVKSISSAQTDQGTYDPTYANRIASLKCLIQGKTLSESDEFSRKTLRNVYRLYCINNATNAAIIESDRVVWGTRTFEITGIKDGGGQSHHLEIELREVRKAD